MLTLRQQRSETVDAAIADASSGQAGVLYFAGASGMGKTSHLQAVRDTATGFRVLAATCEDSAYQPALGLLRDLGVRRTTTDDGRRLSAAAAAQSLRRIIDQESRDEPLLVLIDDVQWADQESIEALRLVLDRISGDRLLVVVAGRPSLAKRTLWEAYSDDSPMVTTVVLDGIDLDEAETLVRRETAQADPPRELVARLWEYVGHNPMYLRSLVRQYRLTDLAALPELPAPVEIARDLNARLARTNADAASLLQAVAVLGPSWVDRLDAATIADIDDPSNALDLLIEHGLLVVRSSVPLADVRIMHALVRDSVYQSIPVARRREMHHRASGLLKSPMRRLEHAVAAADRRDAVLAIRLEDAAGQARAEADYRREAQLWQWASQLSDSATERERRWLAAQLATVLAQDTSAVRANLTEIGWSSDIARRTVVMAWLLIVENRIADARRALAHPSPEVVAHADLLTRTRLLVLKAWTMLVSGYPTGQVKAIIEAVPDAAAADPALRGYYLRTAGQVASRDFDFDHIRADFAAIPVDARETPMADTDKLSWRGAVYSLCGFTAEARRDLSEVVSRVRGGRIDAASGANHALYSLALWYDGEFERAGIELQAGRDLAIDRLYPLVQAMLPLTPAVRGDFDLADALLAESESMLRDLPWQEAVAVHVQAQIVRLHAGHDQSARKSCLARLRSHFGSGVTATDLAAGAIWHLHVGLARVWAGELDEVEPHLIGIETDMIVPDWAGWCRPWLIGLREEHAGEIESAHRKLSDAASLLNSELPLYGAHVHADLARVAGRLGDADGAARSALRARTAYEHLGATPYLRRLPAADPSAHPDPLGALSDREREVAALLLAGFSYAQIAEELHHAKHRGLPPQQDLRQDGRLIATRTRPPHPRQQLVELDSRGNHAEPDHRSTRRKHPCGHRPRRARHPREAEHEPHIPPDPSLLQRPRLRLRDPLRAGEHRRRRRRPRRDPRCRRARTQRGSRRLVLGLVGACRAHPRNRSLLSCC